MVYSTQNDLQQIDSPESKNSQRLGVCLGYVNADYANLICCRIQAQGRSPSCATLYKRKQGVQALEVKEWLKVLLLNCSMPFSMLGLYECRWAALSQTQTEC